MIDHHAALPQDSRSLSRAEADRELGTGPPKRPARLRENTTRPVPLTTAHHPPPAPAAARMAPAGGRQAGSFDWANRLLRSPCPTSRSREEHRRTGDHQSSGPLGTIGCGWLKVMLLLITGLETMKKGGLFGGRSPHAVPSSRIEAGFETGLDMTTVAIERSSTCSDPKDEAGTARQRSSAALTSSRSRVHSTRTSSEGRKGARVVGTKSTEQKFPSTKRGFANQFQRFSALRLEFQRDSYAECVETFSVLYDGKMATTALVMQSRMCPGAATWIVFRCGRNPKIVASWTRKTHRV
ncbi:hypothetical protein ON010_g12326 [Phytophthora cinnamomi]|nr:hypothetical protein ON010_g12326 [Phytophthora cinnamomi]